MVRSSATSRCTRRRRRTTATPGSTCSSTTDRQGLGLGPDAIRAAVRWLVDERGHHRITIDPAADNVAAIRAYERVGFRPVGVMRRYERGADGTWHDGLLMELLADELR